MSNYIIDGNTLTGIANAIRTKTGKTNAFTPSQMITEIENLPTGVYEYVSPYQYSGSNISSYSGNAQYILNSAFMNCTSLITVSVPQCSYLGNYAFAFCYSLSAVSFPECTYIGEHAFDTCYRWRFNTAYFPKCSYIGNNAFVCCENLSSLYLNQVTSVPILASYNAFSATPLSAGGSGKIYVPSSLYNSFLTATNWSYVSARLVSM